ncbi:MAG: HD-GYP domain-containing protein [Candidatus Fimenecus sp.]
MKTVYCSVPSLMSVSALINNEIGRSDRAIIYMAVIAVTLLLIGIGSLIISGMHTAVLKRRQKRYRDITHQSISAIANAVDAKDPYTRGHSDRVAKYAAEIARRYGLKPLKVSDIYYSALLHDIGKIGIPDEILKKPGKLTKEEYEIIKTHAAIGADIVKDITAIPNIRRGICDHHEWYDGSGYPRGLRGNNISLEGRIIGMADAYDAMASARGYSAPHTQDYILSEIQTGQGKQFDPKIAQIVMQMMADGFFEKQQEPTDTPSAESEAKTQTN